MRTIYIDVLFTVNFFMDLVLLALTAAMRGVATSNKRLLLGAGIGGLSAVTLFFLPGGVIPWGIGLGSCMVMTYAAFGRGDFRRRLGDCGMLCLLSMLLSGGTMLLGMLGGPILHSNAVLYFEPSPLLLFLGTILGAGILELLCKPGHFRGEAPVFDVRCTLGGRELTFTAYGDTGNLLRDPIGGKKVILLSASKLREADFSDLSFEGLCGQGLLPGWLPVESASGTALLVTLRPECLTVNGEKTDGYILGLSRGEIEPAPGCRAVMGIG